MNSTKREFIQLLFTNLLSYGLLRYEEKHDKAPTLKKLTIHMGRKIWEQLNRIYMWLLARQISREGGISSSLHWG